MVNLYAEAFTNGSREDIFGALSVLSEVQCTAGGSSEP
jgi:hypothetical protein